MICPLRCLVPPALRPYSYLAELVLIRTKGSVHSGPFRGVVYASQAHGSSLYPKLLGTYERELNYILAAVIQAPPSRFINIGAAEGYYAIGLARSCPQCQVIAYEMSQQARALLAAMAKHNRVQHQIDVRGECTPECLRRDLETVRVGRTVILCDVEGYEDVLLDPSTVPGLRDVAILVEMHDFCAPGVTQRIKDRFSASHLIKEIWQEARSGAEFPFKTAYTRIIPSCYKRKFLDEGRPVRMNWLWMLPRTKTPAGKSPT